MNIVHNSWPIVRGQSMSMANVHEIDKTPFFAKKTFLIKDKGFDFKVDSCECSFTMFKAYL
jgi:hypothetical protein